jgi:small subunit ribosomal protein S8
MSMTDPVADLLTRIRNAAAEKHERVDIPASRLKANLVKVLKDQGFIKNFRILRDDVGHVSLRVYLKYDDVGVSVIRGIRRVSKPGVRHYAKVAKMPRVMGGIGISILTTSKGVMTSEKAAQQKVGGEILCEVW